MKKLIIFNMVSLDGYFERPDRQLDWHVVDKEFDNFAVEQLEAVDTLLFGRVTYELMAGFWPSRDALADDPVVAKLMNQKSKIVFSKTLPKADWQNTRLLRGNVTEEISRLKGLPGKDLIIFGSSDLAVPLSERNLIDEYRLMLNPVLLGSGKSLFTGLQHDVKLKLVQTRPFNSGNILLYYQPARNGA